MNRTMKLMAEGLARAEERPKEPVEKIDASGNWSKMARDHMEALVRETREELEKSQKTQLQAIRDGVLPVEIPADQILDEVGTDRLHDLPGDDGSETESFQSLLKNIKARGLRTPLRVRPLDPEWVPDPDNPADVGSQKFALQSGRRRLAACRELGIKPIAFISAGGPNARQDDLQERFFENAVRKNLSLIEKLHSIGLIAEDMPNASQEQIAEILGINQSYVSRGRAVVRYFTQLSEDLDLPNASQAEIDRQLKIYRESEKSENADAKRMREGRRKAAADAAAGLPFKRRQIGACKASLKVNQKGERVLALQGKSLDDDKIEKILAILESDA